MARRVFLALALLAVGVFEPGAASHRGDFKLDAALQARAHAPRGTSRVIVRTSDPASVAGAVAAVDGRPGPVLARGHALVAEVADSRLDGLASLDEVQAISLDRPVRATMDRTAAVVGAQWVTEQLGFDGSGIGIATIDSGVSIWHDDIAAGRIAHFADFLNEQRTPYDDYGHGTHVAGIIAGSGDASAGRHRGIAPGAHLVVLKALDGTGGGFISNVIAAVDYAIEQRETYNIRVINLSVAAGVYESYLTDPLTLAARRAVDAGIVVVAAAGNLGRTALGRARAGGIAAPGNAPWVLTVGAADQMGTLDRADDVVAAFSSRGPASIDFSAKPDLVAPGVNIESTAEPSSLLFALHPASRRWGTRDSISEPYLSLSGTSMAAPVVAATVGLMLQANPLLTPNAVKALLQYTAERRREFDHLTQGAGFLNARGAVQLARAFSGAGPLTIAGAGDPVPWGRQIIWGNVRVAGGTLAAGANAWDRSVTWGDRATAEGDRIVWGSLCGSANPDCADSWSLRCDALESSCDDPPAGRLREASQPACLTGAGCDAPAWEPSSHDGAPPEGYVMGGSVAVLHEPRPAARRVR